MLRYIDKGMNLHRFSRPADSGGNRDAQVASRYRQMVATAFALLADRALAV
ncbi:MAG: hypothetical protein QOI13_838 [Paraburkholderia sp.]|jgi:hypothetical protein|nr:hypothetical protein [Paraburkholderia sp.]MEA3122136.1 hypothetical protein [Paraburkholderia sp.]